jgi:integrase
LKSSVDGHPIHLPLRCLRRTISFLSNPTRARDPSKRHIRPLVHFLERPEIDALLGAPDQTTWFGRRDHAVLLVAVQTGLRVSELTGLLRSDVILGTGADVRCTGKGPERAMHTVDQDNCLRAESMAGRTTETKYRNVVS